MGGHYNLEQYCASKAHRARMTAQQAPKITTYFSQQPKITSQKASAPHFPALQSRVLPQGKTQSTVLDAGSEMSPSTSIMARSNKITELRLIAARLPLSIPEASPKARLAPFATKPIFNPAVNFWEESGDSVLNNLIGYGQKDSEIEKIIQWGAYGIDGLLNWIEAVCIEGGVSEVLLEGKLETLGRVLQKL